MTDIVPIRRALISLSDKTGLDELAAALTGAYLIEVLCENLGATYVPNEAVAGPLAYEVALADGTATHPVLQAYDRLAGKRMLPLSDYVARVAKKR